MDKKRRTSLIGGGLLILIGTALVLVQALPGYVIQFSWPWVVIAVGLALLALGAGIGEPGLAVPATIVGGIGGILAYQQATGAWESWSYLWTLIPGLVGLGIIFMNFLAGGETGSYREGLTLLLISLIMLSAFGSFFGVLGMAGKYWPVLLILLGLALMGQTLFGRHDQVENGGGK